VTVLSDQADGNVVQFGIVEHDHGVELTNGFGRLLTLSDESHGSSIRAWNGRLYPRAQGHGGFGSGVGARPQEHMEGIASAVRPVRGSTPRNVDQRTKSALRKQSLLLYTKYPGG